MHKCFITWIGSEEGRVCNGIEYVTPDEVYFLLESKTPQWIEFQKESLKNILNYFGELYETGYLFSWDDVPGNDNNRLINFLRTDLYIDWVENAEIKKTDGDRTISISSNGKSVEITLDKTEKRAMIKTNDGKTYDLQMKNEDNKLNLYNPKSKGHEVIFDLNGFSPEEQTKEIFNTLYNIISNVRDKKPDVKITIDTTSSPKPILFVLTFVAMTLSTDKSGIILLSVPKAFKSTPMYYAATESNFFEKYIDGTDKAEITIYDYRQMAKKDKGGEPILIELPHSNFEILNPQGMDDLKLLALFSILPPHKQEPLSSDEILIKVYEENKDSFTDFAPPYLFTWDHISQNDVRQLFNYLKRLKKDFDIGWADKAKIEKDDSDRTINISSKEKSVDITLDKTEKRAILKISDDKTYNLHVEEKSGHFDIYGIPIEENRGFKIWIGKNLEKLRTLGVIELNKPGKKYFANKSWGGYLISGATDKLYEKGINTLKVNQSPNYLKNKLK